MKGLQFLIARVKAYIIIMMIIRGSAVSFHNSMVTE